MRDSEIVIDVPAVVTYVVDQDTGEVLRRYASAYDERPTYVWKDRTGAGWDSALSAAPSVEVADAARYALRAVLTAAEEDRLPALEDNTDHSGWRDPEQIVPAGEEDKEGLT